MKLVLATRNGHKIREMTQILARVGIEAVPQQALGCDLVQGYLIGKPSPLR